MNHRFLIGAFALAAATLAAAGASAQGFPNRQVTILVGQQPGGPTDTLTRMVAAHLKDALGQPVVVENKPGAGTNLAAETMLQAKPDGHVLFVGGLGPFTVNDILYSKLAFKPERDFALIAILGRTPHVFAVNPEVPVKTLAEFVAYAKTRGGALNHASPGVGTFPHLAAELLRMQAAFASVHVPFRGSTPATLAVATGEVQWNVDSIKLAAAQHRAGKARVLAVTSTTRLKGNEDLPTAAEAGMPEMAVSAWFALMAPAATPAAVVRKINDDATRGLRGEEFARRIEPLGHEAAPMSPDETARFLAAERERWARVIRANGIKAD